MSARTSGFGGTRDCTTSIIYRRYVADPMCSWCRGFAPVIDAIHKEFGTILPIRLVMGGLRPGTTKPLDEASKASMREHWKHVHDASGQPFDFGFFERQDFLYDTEPPARAVVVMRRHAMEAALDYLASVQRAFYAENQDMTDPEALTDLAAAHGHDREAFLRAFGSEDARQETWTDFAAVQRAGIRGFPTLLAGPQDGGFGVMTYGYQPPDRVLSTLRAWLEAVRRDTSIKA